MTLVPPDDNTAPTPHIVVIGGGIAGLTAAWQLSRPHLARDPAARRLQPRIVVLESANRFGGKIHTTELAGLPVDTGPDAFLARVPHAVRLCQELGISDLLTSPVQERAWIWSRGKLRLFPTGTLLGVPTGLGVLARSGLVSPWAVARAGADLVLRDSRNNAKAADTNVGDDNKDNKDNETDDDPSIADVVGKRLGQQVIDRLVDPLVGNINCGNVSHLSLISAAPQLAEAFSHHRSLMVAARQQLRKRRQAAAENNSNGDGDNSDIGKSAPTFLAPQGGMSTLVNTLLGHLSGAGARLYTGITVSGLRQNEGRQWWVEVEGHEPLLADAVIIATPAFVTAQILADACPEASAPLFDIEYSSVNMVRLAYTAENVRHALDGSGFVVPAVDGHLLTACSWASSKWAHLNQPDQIIFRASVGRLHDDRSEQMSDKELMVAVHRELARTVGVHRRPLAGDVTRWPSSFPQYEPGHGARVSRIERAVSQLPGLAVAGAAYHGLGIPACIRTANEAAESVLAHLGARYS